MTVQFKLAENKRKSKRIPPPSCFYSRHDDWRARTDRNPIDWEMFQNLGENSCLPSLPISRWSARTRSGHAQQVVIKALLQFVLWTKARDMLGNVLEKKTVKTNDTTLRNLTTHSHLSCWKENLWNICFICGKVPTQWKSGKSETHKTEPSAKTNEKKNKLNHKTLVTAHFNSADNENNNT